MGRRLVGLLQMALIMVGRVVVYIVSYIVFGVLDLLDPVLCVVYKMIDYLVEAEWKPCYCFSTQEDCSSRSRRSILVNSPEGKTKIVCHCLTKVQMEDISDTLYSRKPLFRELVMSTVFCIKKLRVFKANPAAVLNPNNQRLRTATLKPAFAVNSSTIVESLQGHKGQLQAPVSPRWSDCDCPTCASWHSSCKETLFFTVEGKGSEIFDVPQDNKHFKAGASDVIFIHGFISSSTFWTETVFPNFSELTKSKYRLFAVDLLGFGRSPKPTDSLYTLTEHVDMIERSIMRPHRIKSFHVVAHSLGCIIALALAARYPGAVSSLTLLAPPYFPVPCGVEGSDFVLRQLAPKKVWPPIAFGASIASWYEHVSRTVCLLICKQHRFWDFIARQITRNRIRTFLIDGFMCHTHHAAWHTLHNVICGTANKMDAYLDLVRKQEACKVTVFHGRDDELLPAKCSEDLKCKIPRARVKIIEKTDHITIVVGRQKIFARELEEIWKEK
ncbi:hypothetical protein SUGI_1167560 [Cryptomeria japonica]|nr:hypothetical protein SUGI_1167560 [Cryptomeria japonica]